MLEIDTLNRGMHRLAPTTCSSLCSFSVIRKLRLRVALAALVPLCSAAAPVLGQATISGSATAAVSFPATAVGKSAPVQNISVKLTASESITSITVPVSLGNKQEYTIGAITGCSHDGTTTNPSGTVCTVPVTFSPAYPGPRPAPLQIVTSTGNINFGLLGSGTGPFAVFEPGILKTIAGTGTAGLSQAGYYANGTPLGSASGVAVDNAGNVYFADSKNNAVLMIGASDGIISFVAGSPYGASGFSGDGGLATSADLNSPSDIAFDAAGNLYIVDKGNFRVRMVNTATGIITTVAGNGTNGSSGDNGPATSAELAPNNIAIDLAGNLYLSDIGHDAVRKVTAATKVISTLVAGVQNGDQTTLHDPNGLAVDTAGNVYIAENGYDLVMELVAATNKLVNFAGFFDPDSDGDFRGDGGPATAAYLAGPSFLKLDGAGDLYITDYNNDRVREVSAATGIINTVVGNGGETYTSDGVATGVPVAPLGLAVDGQGNLYLSDGRTPRVYEVTVGTTSTSFPLVTLLGQTNTLSDPQTTALSNIGTAALILSVPPYDSNPSISPDFSLSGGSTCPQLSVSSSAYSIPSGGNCVLALTFTPTASGPSAGTLNFTDNSLNVPSAMQTVSLSGTGTAVSETFTVLTTSVYPSNFGQAISFTAGVSFASGNGIPAGTVQFIIDGVPFGTPVTVVDSGDGLGDGAAVSQPITTLSVGTHTITANFIPAMPSATGASSAAPLQQRVLPVAGKVTLSGAASTLTFPTTAVGATSPAQTVSFKTTATETIVSVTVPVSQGNHQEYTLGKITGCVADGKTSTPSGTVCSVPVTFSPAYPGARPAPFQIVTSTGNFNLGLTGTGTGPLAALLPGILTSPTLAGPQPNSPMGSTTDSAGNLYYADPGASTVSRFNPATGIVTVVAGVRGDADDEGDGDLATLSHLNHPVDVAIDSAGNLYIAQQGDPDDGDSTVRLVSAATGVISTVAGSGHPGYTGDNGPATAAYLSPSGVALDSAGNLYISDATDGVVRKVAAATNTITTFAGNGTQGDTGDGGPATSAELSGPMGLAFDSAGNLYIADSLENVIRKVTVATSKISTVAGTPYTFSSGGTFHESGDGAAPTAAYLSQPTFIKLDSAGNLYITDAAAGTVRKVDVATNIITTVAGGLQTAFDSPVGIGGPATSAEIGTSGIALDGAGNLFISDADDYLILQISASAAALVYPTDTPAGSPDTTDDPQTATLANIGNTALSLTPPSTGTNPSVSPAWSIDSSSTCPKLTSASSPSTLATGATCTIAVDFTPTQAAAMTGTLTVTDNSLNIAASLQTATLTGNATTVVTPPPPPPPPVPESILITASYNPTTFGQPVFFGAQVVDPNYSYGVTPYGTVQFSIDGKPFGPPVSPDPDNNGTLFSMTTTTLSVGSHTITAVYTPACRLNLHPSLRPAPHGGGLCRRNYPAGHNARHLPRHQERRFDRVFDSRERPGCDRWHRKRLRQPDSRRNVSNRWHR